MTAPANTIELIKGRLTEVFAPDTLTIIDESHLHVGHAGAQSGKGHYAVEIRAAVFADKTPVMRHRLIYQALGNLMDTHIHALCIKASH